MVLLKGSANATQPGDPAAVPPHHAEGWLTVTKTIALLVLVLTSQSMALSPEEIARKIEATQWMTEQYPPYNYVDEKDGELKGITVDILMLMFKKVGVRLKRGDIKVLPWALGYKQVLEKPGTALFSTTYTTERLKQFKFVGPIIPTRVAVIADTSRGFVINSAEDLHLLTVAVVRDDIGDQLIRTEGVKKEAIRRNHFPGNMIKMLSTGKVTAIAYAEDVARHRFVRAGIDPGQYESVFILQESHMGYAFHLSTDANVLDPLTKALDELRADGVVDSIRVEYLGE